MNKRSLTEAVRWFPQKLFSKVNLIDLVIVRVRPQTIVKGMKDNVQSLVNHFICALFPTATCDATEHFVFCRVLQALGMLSVLILILRMEQTVEKVPLAGGIRI